MMVNPLPVCPKCGHARAANDVAPSWQCPACGIAYHKYAAYLARARQGAQSIVTPPRAGEAAPVAALDGSVWMLVAANVLALGVALWQGWGPAPLMLLYWGQSVIIGVANVFRILALDRFSTENFTMNNRPVDPTPATKRQVAGFFAMHYGLFHVGYLVFIVAGPRGEPLTPWFWACTAAFALNHLWSYRYNRDIDRQGTPNIGTLMFTPYLRIVPMHVTIIIGGGLFFGGKGGLLLFALLKIVADVLMHLVEHSQLQKVRAGQAVRP